MKDIFSVILCFSCLFLYSRDKGTDSVSLSQIDELKKDKGRNIVPNFSFEEFNQCPGHNSIIPKSYFVDDWIMATIGTPDYFNYCSSEAGVPNNWTGSLPARSGYAYVGLIAGMFVNEDGKIEEKREYIEATLTKPLEKGRYYYLCFSTSLAARSRYAINGIGMYLSDTVINTKESISHLPFIPQLMAAGNPIIKNIGHWTDIYGIYKAKGTEKYIILGNFQSDKETNSSENEIYSKLNCSYYLFDDVYIIPLDFVSGDDFNFKETQAHSSSKVNVLFDFDDYKLKSIFQDDLMRLSREFHEGKWKLIEIKGYSDSIGTDNYNDALSLKRAQSVANFLVKKRIPRQKLLCKGYGKRNFVSGNSTEKGRALNRRVEIIVK